MDFIGFFEAKTNHSTQATALVNSGLKGFSSFLKLIILKLLKQYGLFIGIWSYSGRLII